MIAVEGPIEIRPQPGPQELFLSTPADIGIFGGAVHGGKTWALEVEVTRHVPVEGFNFVLFRRTMPEHTKPGGTWDESYKIYPYVGGQASEHVHEWHFPSGAWGQFSHLQYEKDVENWKSAQICLLMFDQLEMFTERQFFYMLSRNRSSCGVKPYVRASCNPDPDSFLFTFLSWWIDQDSGYAIPERSGTIRFFIRLNDEVYWSTETCTPEQYPDYYARREAAEQELAIRFGTAAKYLKSVTFVLSRLEDNVIGNTKDPEYEANIRAMSHVDQMRLLGDGRGGNWKIRPSAGLVFRREWIEVVDALPRKTRKARGWDKAATLGAGDWTCGGKLEEAEKVYYIADMKRVQLGPDGVDKLMLQTAKLDGRETKIRCEQEPGSAGKRDAIATIRLLAGFDVACRPSTGDKETRARPFAAQCQAGNVKILKLPGDAGEWVEGLLRRLEAFPTTGVPDDEIDALVAAFEALTGVSSYTAADFATVRR